MTDLSLLQLEALAEGPKANRLPLAALLRRIPIGIYSTLVLLGAWQLAATLKLVPPLFLPAPIDVIRQFIAITGTGFSNATL
jgi:taurine transport system permease protein